MAILDFIRKPGLYMRALFCSKDKSKFQMNVKMNSDRLPLWQIVLYSYKWAFQINLKPSDLQGFIDTSFTIWSLIMSIAIQLWYLSLILSKKLYEKFNTNHQYVWARSHKLSRAQWIRLLHTRTTHFTPPSPLMEHRGDTHLINIQHITVK